MAKTQVSEWDTDPALNTEIDGIDISEGCSPAGINNAIREAMSQIATLNPLGNSAIGVSVQAYSAALANYAQVGVTSFSVRDATNAGFIAAMPDGEVAFMEGLLYTSDSTKTGVNSATNDLGQDGVWPAGAWQPEHFGPAGANDDARMQAMFTAAQGAATVVALTGNYTITTAMTLTTSAAVAIYGAGTGVSTITCTDCDFIAVDQSSASVRESCLIDGLTILTTTNGTRTAITYTGKSGSSLGKQLQVQNCSFDGSTNSTGWEYPIDATEADFGSITGCFFTGNTSDRTVMHAAVKLTDTTDFHVTRNHIYWCDIGVEVGVTGSNVSEGITVAFNHIVPVNTGVQMTGTGNLLWVNDNHISAYERGVVLGATGVNGVNHSHVKGNLIFKNALSSSDFIGIECFGNKPDISGNEFLIPSGSAAGGTQKGIYLDGQADYARVIGNQVANMDEGIELASGVLYPNIVGNAFLSNTTNFSDLGSTGRAVYDAQHSLLLPGFSATAIASSAAVVNTSDKFAGKIVRDTTNDRAMMARGSGATAAWDVIDGSASVTPA